MALQTSGAISLNEIHVEAGGSSGSQASINDSDIRDLISKSSGAQMSFSEWYGATAETVLTSAGTVNGQNQRQEITASSFISSGGTLRIPSNLWVWSDSTSTAALTIDISCTIIVEGKVIGRGGNAPFGSNKVGANGASGGPAIKINSGVSGVTIQNASGGYIAGGGGSGSVPPNSTFWGGAGGGAGGGDGSDGGGTGGQIAASDGGVGGSGGALNASGSDSTNLTNYFGRMAGGGGGGRILPGTGGAKGDGDYGADGGGAGGGGCGKTNGFEDGADGGSAGNAAVNVGHASFTQTGSGGGGGWGAKGSNTLCYFGSKTGGSGGKAIDDSGVSYSLSNSGTIYGGT